MKLFSYILAFYLFFLSAVPCCAFDDCPDDKTEQQGQHENGDADCGNCSPFFSCQRCTIATTTPKTMLFDFSISISTPERVVYLQQHLPSIQYDFWQPPKLG